MILCSVESKIVVAQTQQAPASVQRSDENGCRRGGSIKLGDEKIDVRRITVNWDIWMYWQEIQEVEEYCSDEGSSQWKETGESTNNCEGKKKVYRKLYCNDKTETSMAKWFLQNNE